ncbi:uncharacterized protein LOC129584890 [Paramacrobiotus metropolitanus]|uniref:uncharacterized protein LOC129584890 n=1 Tax=Paramacrobiotus metropolitanus TaxID=2943436 RepID=UPI002445BCCD|nr:uncharacterized protein LOC129584890 [Paramacrobiotus metropolitanus]
MFQSGSLTIGVLSSLIVIGTQFGISKLICGLLGLVCILIVIGVLDFLRTRDWSFTLWVAAKRYVFSRAMLLIGIFYAEPHIQWATRNPRESQERILRSAINSGVKTKYGKEHGLNRMKDREDFRNLHPLTKYVHYEPYVERMISGEADVLSTKAVNFYGLTSGTTGKPSRIPCTSDILVQMMIYYMPFVIYSYAFKFKGFPFPGGLCPKRRLALLFSPGKLLKTTPLGIKMGPGTAMYLEQDEVFSYPNCAKDIIDERTARYVYLVFGLKYRDLEEIESMFSSIAFIVFHEMELHWKELVVDIREGKLKSDLQLSVEERAALQQHLTPDPIRAAELEREFQKGFDNIVERVWPKLKLLLGVTSGPFAHYKMLLRDKYIKNVPIFQHMYGCTEAMLGISLWPEKESTVHLLWPCNVFYEFIPFEQITDENPETVFADQVQIGHEYELVITTKIFYRYRFGDLIRVVDRYNKFPVIEILTRTGQLINMKGEKVSETAIYTAINNMAAVHNKVKKIVDYTSCESMFMEYVLETTAQDSAFYVIFIEADLSLENTSRSEMETICSKTLDEKLCEAHGRYKYQREKGGLDCLKVIFLPIGTFFEFRTFMLQNSTTASAQLKLPKVLKKPELLRFMLSKSGLLNSPERRGSKV